MLRSLQPTEVVGITTKKKKKYRTEFKIDKSMTLHMMIAEVCSFWKSWLL